MGVDITGYKTLGEKLADDYEEFEEKWPDFEDEPAHVFLYQIEKFEDRGDGIEPGIYAVTGETESTGNVHYSYYNMWRLHLSEWILGKCPSWVWTHREECEGQPFYELIDFADNEGYLGPETSASLYHDFAKYRDHFERCAGLERRGDGLVKLYLDLEDIFRLAMVEGVVSFR